MQTLEIVQENALIKAGEQINQGLAAFDHKKAELEALAESAKELTINGIDDKQGYKIADQKRKELKVERVDITKQGKAMRDQLTAVSKGIISKEKELIAIIEGEETRLVNELAEIDAEKEQIRKEEEAKKELIIQERITVLAKYGFQIDYSEIKAMDFATFEQYKEEAWVQFEKAEEERKEAERLEIERLKKEAEEKRLEAERLAAERKELEELREKQAEAQRIIDEKNAEAQRVIDEQNAAIQKAKDELEAEKKRIADAEKAKADAILREQEMEKAKKEAAEKARLQAIQDQKDKEAADKAEKERQEEEARIKAEQAPDRSKINLYVKSIQDLEVPSMKSANGKKIMASIQELVTKLTSYSTEKANTL